MEKMMKITGNSFLPDEIITNILSKLPAKSVMRCRLVCKTWRDVTLSRYFVDLNLRNSIPSILVTRGGTSRSGFDLYVLEQWWESTDTSLLIHRLSSFSEKFSKARAQLSHSGLIVLRENNGSESKFIILNPARPSNECVTIILPQKLYRSQMYGVYFHPLLKEYCALLVIEELVGSSFWDEQSIRKYKIVNLGSNPSSKTISNPCGRKLKLGHANPTLMKNYLYWLLECGQWYRDDGHNDIMEFDIRNEEFKIIPCPVPLNTECTRPHTHLLNIDGILCFILLMSCKITIWRLEDRIERLWTATTYTLNIETCQYWEAVGGIAVVNGKLAILSSKILYVYNLMEGTVQSFQKSMYGTNAVFSSHQMSLASLKNCKSTISIGKYGEVVQDEPDLW